MAAEFNCWKCGASLASVPQPLGRRAECPTCRADLHVCRQCRHFDTAKAKQCRELAADEVRDKTRANFCEWFQPGIGNAPGNKQNTTTPSSRSELDKLFGE